MRRLQPEGSPSPVRRGSGVLSVLFLWLLLAGLAPATLHGSIPRDRPPAVVSLALIEEKPAAERAASAFPPARLELDISEGEAGVPRRVLVRQNPWSMFDPEGLLAGEAAWQATRQAAPGAIAAGAGSVGFGGASVLAAGGSVVGATGAGIGFGWLGIIRTANIVQFGSPYPQMGGFRPMGHIPSGGGGSGNGKRGHGQGRPDFLNTLPDIREDTEPPPPQPATDGAGARKGGGKDKDDSKSPSGTTARETVEKTLSDDALVVKGGLSKNPSIDTFVEPGVGTVTGTSVSSEVGTTITELATGIKNGQIRTTTVGAVRAVGGDVIPTRRSDVQPYHATLTGLDKSQIDEVLGPPMPNPAK